VTTLAEMIADMEERVLNAASVEAAAKFHERLDRLREQEAEIRRSADYRAGYQAGHQAARKAAARAALARSEATEKGAPRE